MLNKKGFTLIEVIITIMILSLVFSVLAFSIYSTIKNSVDIKGQSEKLKEDASFFWDMQKKFSTNTKTFLRNNNGYPILVLYNTSGNYYKGLVKSVFFVKDNDLYYYEFPYMYGDPYFYDEKQSYKVLHFENLDISVVIRGKSFKDFEGNPDMLIIQINDKRMVFK